VVVTARDEGTGQAETLTASEADGPLAKASQMVAQRLQRELGPACQTLVRTPFVLGGDMTASELESRYAETIEPAVRAMLRHYFKTSPSGPITVLLFRDQRSYDDYAQRLFGESGISIYGYYKPSLRTVILNLSTGDGTLLHELTHALMDFDFPQAPDWLNEGLASLHEQCRFRNDGDGPWIEGLANWRLDGLKRVIRAGQLPSNEELLRSVDFRGPSVGINYAQARYFCMYLQQQGRLKDLYRACRDGRADDPSGLLAAARTTSDSTWLELDRDFQRWVLALKD
jgi:hypothetical protein